MLQTLEVGPWTLRCDPAETRNAYAAISTRGPAECGCCGCRNWLAQPQQVFTPMFLSLCDRLGIAPDKEVEVHWGGRLPSGLYSYGAWWHFVGRIEAGPRWRPPSLDEFAWTPSGADPLQLLVREKADLVPKAFQGHQILQLDLFTELPWVLREPEPDPPS